MTLKNISYGTNTILQSTNGQASNGEVRTGENPARTGITKDTQAVRSSSNKITLRQLAVAVAKAEGWQTKNSLAQRQKNPCNIRKACTLGKSNGFGHCKTGEDGFKLCETTLNWYISRDKTLQGMIQYFSPASDGNKPIQHANNIAKLAGIEKNIPLKNLIK